VVIAREYAFSCLGIFPAIELYTLTDTLETIIQCFC